MNLEDLQKRLDENTAKIMYNLEQIEHNSTKIDENSEKIQKNSYALEILSDYKTGFNRWHTFAIIFLILWVITLGYLIYTLTDIGVDEEITVTQENSDGYNNYIGNDGEIINGKASD